MQAGAAAVTITAKEILQKGAKNKNEKTPYISESACCDHAGGRHARRIGRDAFLECVHLATVRFGGSKEQWAGILIESGNDPLGNAEVLF